MQLAQRSGLAAAGPARGRRDHDAGIMVGYAVAAVVILLLIHGTSGTAGPGAEVFAAVAGFP